MKFNISLKVLPLLACGMLMASCNDFLKQEPLTDITPTDYYKDATQLQAVANAFYQTVLPYHSGAGYGTFAYDNGTDNQTGSDGDSKYKKVVGRQVTTTLHGAGIIFVISTIS